MKNIIPEHQNGIQTNTERVIDFETDEQAKEFFEKAKERLLDINRWHDLAGNGSANFQLTDSKGTVLDRKARTGDHFKINIPAPGTITGEGSDWVQIEAIEEDENCLGIRVRPATNPTNERTDVAHFFAADATSSFVVKRENTKVIAGVYGRNEKPNTDTETIADTIRNIAVATGAITGLAKLQWKSLVNGLVGND